MGEQEEMGIESTLRNGQERVVEGTWVAVSALVSTGGQVLGPRGRR